MRHYGRVRALVALAGLSLVAAGCGGGGGTSASGGVGVTTDPKGSFVQACGSCHTLAAAGTHGTSGPNLDELRPSAQDVVHAVEDGPGAMPVSLLSYRDTGVVARYVASVAGTG